MAACKAAGEQVPGIDAWVAATALRHDIPLITNNLRHFERVERHCGLVLLRPDDNPAN